MSKRFKGRVADWKDDRGFGFISPSDGGEQVFVHISAFANRQRRPTTQDVVTYELSRDRRQRLRADNVAFAGERSPNAAALDGPVAVTAFVIVFFIALAIAAWQGVIPGIVLGLYAAASVVTAGAYALDKASARTDGRRVAEQVLIVLGLVGGWPGGLLAIRLFRHKTRKQSFQIAFWVSAVLNCGVLAWVLTPAGGNTLRALLGQA